MSEDKKICPFMSKSSINSPPRFMVTYCVEDKCMAWGVVGEQEYGYRVGQAEEDSADSPLPNEKIYGCKLIERPR